MRFLPGKFIPILAAVLILGFAASAASAGKTTEEINALISKEKSELELLRAKIKKHDKSLFMAGQKESFVLKSLGKMDYQLELKQRELRIYGWNNKVNKKKIAALSTSIFMAEKKLQRQEKILGKRLRAIYKEGNMFPIKVMFSAENFNDLIQRIKYMGTIAEHDSSMFQKYGGHLIQLKEQKRALLNARTNLVRLEESAVRKKKEIENQKREKSRFLRRLNKEKKLSLGARKELVRASENLNELILKLKEKLVLGEGLDFGDRKGNLKFPVPGRILNKFGKKRDKHYTSYIVYNGINIKVPKGTSVRAVSQGKVLYAETLEGYGNLVILGHGKDYHSLYGHLDEIITKVGRIVRTNQIIGKSGDTGSLVGETLYFELRHQGKPIEPTRWFRLTKK